MKSLLLVAFLIGLTTFSFAQNIPSYTADQLMKRAKGKDTVYVLNFWATWCSPCIAELPAFDAITEEYAGKKVKVILVSMDFPEAYPAQVQAFINKKNLKSEVVWLWETNANVFIPKIDNRWTGALPATVIIDNKTGKKQFFEKKMSKEELEKAVGGS
jgi:thiol-disulfide isomerase/thioredoxin